MRITRDVLNIIHECDQRLAFVTVLDPHVSTHGEAGIARAKLKECIKAASGASIIKRYIA